MSTLNADVRRASPLKAYVTRHLQVAIASLGRLARAPFSSLTTMLVIGITLALPAALHLGVRNVQGLSGGWESAVDFSVFFVMDIDEAAARTLGELIVSRADIESLEFVSADAARDQFSNDPVFAATLASLETNPLPHGLIVRPKATLSQASIDALRSDLANLPEIDRVQLDTDWVQRFNAMLSLIERAVQIFAGLLAVAILIIIGNTIRLDIQNREQEIVVTKLVGASNGFVRRPFLYTGFCYGLAGGLLALVLVWIMLSLLDDPVQQLAGLYATGYELKGLNAKEAGLLVATGAGLGWFGSLIATVRHLRRIEPR